MHTRANESRVYPAEMGFPGVPKRWGMTAVQPMAAAFRAKSATSGVIPGSSLMTTMAGPEPVRYTSLVRPSAVKLARVKPSSSTGMAPR